MKEKILHISRVHFDNPTKANTYARLPISNHSIDVKLCIVSFYFRYVWYIAHIHNVYIEFY